MEENNAKKIKLDDEVPNLKTQLEGVIRERDEVTKQRDKALEENKSFQHVMEVMRSKVPGRAKGGPCHVSKVMVGGSLEAGWVEKIFKFHLLPLFLFRKVPFLSTTP